MEKKEEAQQHFLKSVEMTRFASFFLTTVNCISEHKCVFNNTFFFCFFHKFFFANFHRQNNYFLLFLGSSKKKNEIPECSSSTFWRNVLLKMPITMSTRKNNKNPTTRWWWAADDGSSSCFWITCTQNNDIFCNVCTQTWYWCDCTRKPVEINKLITTTTKYPKQMKVNCL